MTFTKKTEQHRPFLSIIIPAFNEEERLPGTLDKISRYLTENGYKYEVIVVDDGSNDATISVVRGKSEKLGNIKLLINGTNRGKGYSVNKGMMEAEGRYVVFSDADLSTPIEEAGKLLECLENGFDIAIASRSLKESDVKIHQPFYREYMGKTFNVFVRLFALRGIMDTQCGFKGFKSEVVRDIFKRQRIEHFSFDVEVLYIARKMGCSIKEVPVEWFNVLNSRVSPFGDSWRMLLDLLKIKYYDFKGYYQ